MTGKLPRMAAMEFPAQMFCSIWNVPVLPKTQFGGVGVQVDSLEHITCVIPTGWYPWLQEMVRL